MITLNEFHEDFKQSVMIEAESRGLMKSQAFFGNVCEELIGTGDLSNNYSFAEYIKNGIEVHGYDYDEERKILSILTYEFFQEEEIKTLTKSIIDTKFKRLKNFLKKCESQLFQSMEETSEAYSMAYNIYNYLGRNKVKKIRLIILTDGKMTGRLKEIPSENINDITFEFRIIDLEYIYKIYLSQYVEREFEVKINIPCLEIPSNSDTYESFLTVISGTDLVEVYDKYGQALLEQNVRTFLQFKGGVNKGIRNTIEYKPEMFFAYNNGITATASSVERNNEGNIILIKDFQIVNGGQTTSAIYAANKTAGLNVEDVSVPMKLSVVKNKEKQNDFVSKVSEYANTQNKVNKSDFFSNNPFHKEMKEYSKRIWAPIVDGAQRRTKWFYERVRGEYLNEQAYLTQAGKKQFQLEYPKKQLIDKTFLAKSEVAWMQCPNIVSKGAQYSFSYFAETVTKKLEKDNLYITESYFKDTVSRILLFKSVEKLITEAEWYNGGFRAQTVAYTISYLSHAVELTGKYINFNCIWEKQSLPLELISYIKDASEKIYNKLTNPPEGYANVAQWAKQEKCWEDIKDYKFNRPLSNELLLDKEQLKYSKSNEIKEKKIDKKIEIQMMVVGIKTEDWVKLYDYYKTNYKDYKITMTQMDILKKTSTGVISLPSEKQSKILYDLYTNAVNDGVVL